MWILKVGTVFTTELHLCHLLCPRTTFCQMLVQIAERDGLNEGASTSHDYLPNAAAETTYNVPSQNDSVLSDNSVICGSDVVHSPTKSNADDNNQTWSNEKEALEGTGPRYPKRSIERLNYKDLEVPEDDEFICKSSCGNKAQIYYHNSIIFDLTALFK